MSSMSDLEKSGGYVLITSETVHRLHGESEAIVVPDGDRCKTLEWAKHCWEVMWERGLGRDCVVVGRGGGSVCDLAGFVAACYMRGVACRLIPTTLLAMVDAAHGGKNGVNLGGKNVVGTMWDAEVELDLKYLETLPEEEICSGLAEIVKYGVIDGELFERLEESLEIDRELIERCVAIKWRCVRGERDILNYGHTFGHAIELLGYRHGEAVAIGMHAAAKLGRLMGLGDVVERQQALLEKVGLPTEFPKKNVWKFLHRDKKGRGVFVLPRAIGEVEVVDGIEEELVVKAIS